MPDGSTGGARWLRPTSWLLLVFAGWSAYALVLMYQSALWWWSAGRLPTVWYGPLIYAFGVVWTWAALTPVVVWIARRFPFRAGALRTAIAVHIPCAFAVTIVVGIVEYMISRLLPGGTSAFVPTYVQRFDSSAFFYAGTVAVTHAIDHARAIRAERVRLADARTQLKDAQLQHLRTQIQPHFLFNTLNTISSMIGRDPEAADAMVSRLGDLLRMSLEETNATETSVARELESAMLYAEIEQHRFADWLQVRVDVSPDTLDAAVPPFLLQPLIENAIRHGIAPSRRPGTVRIATCISDDRLEIVVADDGVGFDARGGQPGRGIGLSSIQARLAHLYGEEHSLRIRSEAGEGTEIRVRIPLRRVVLPERARAAAVTT
jgi:two-component system, LytTR family, sensor kinase